jgi:hypothetical protein
MPSAGYELAIQTTRAALDRLRWHSLKHDDVLLRREERQVWERVLTYIRDNDPGPASSLAKMALSTRELKFNR